MKHRILPGVALNPKFANMNLLGSEVYKGHIYIKKDSYGNSGIEFRGEKAHSCIREETCNTPLNLLLASL